jgi:hypothetical protein
VAAHQRLEGGRFAAPGTRDQNRGVVVIGHGVWLSNPDSQAGPNVSRKLRTEAKCAKSRRGLAGDRGRTGRRHLARSARAPSARQCGGPLSALPRKANHAMLARVRRARRGSSRARTRASNRLARMHHLCDPALHPLKIGNALHLAWLERRRAAHR